MNEASIEENPLPLRLNNRSITQTRRVPTPPNLIAMHQWMDFQDENRHRMLNHKDATVAFRGQTEMPRRVSPSHRNAVSISDPFEPFRNHIHTTISGDTTLRLDDKTSIDMGKVDIATAVGMLRREVHPNGFVMYKVDGKPEIEMIILLDGRIALLHPPSPPTNFIARLLRRKRKSNKIFPSSDQPGGRRRRTRARKMGRIGTNKRRRRCMNHTRGK